MDRGPTWSLNDIQAIAPPYEIMTFTRYELSLGLARLLGEGRLLPALPSQTGIHGQPYSLVVQMEG